MIREELEAPEASASMNWLDNDEGRGDGDRAVLKAAENVKRHLFGAPFDEDVDYDDASEKG